MIFVILGICVLVASFLIALVSLVREQSKLSEAAARDEADQTLAVNNGLKKAKKQAVLEQTGKSAADDVLAKQAVDANKPAINNRPLFPWEEGKYRGAGDMADADREKVEMLRAQLAELKSRVAAKSPSEDETKVPVVKPKARQEQQRLSGEISIADLKRQ